MAAPLGLQDAKTYADDTDSRCGALLSSVRELSALAEGLDLSRETYNASMLSFAESLLTDKLGEEQLTEGEEEIQAGAEKLEQGQARYNAGKAQLDSAKAQYEDGLARYNEGLAQYEAARKELEAGNARLAEGQAQYDEGQAQLAAAKQEYAEGEAQLKRIEPIYNAVLPLYNHYQELQAQYDAAEAAGDTEKMLLLKPRLDAAKLAFETQIAGTGYSLSQIMEEYQAGQAKLNSGAEQIAAAEEQLAAAKTELDAGYAQAAEGQAQLDAAQAELDAAKAQLDAGKAQIDAGEQQLGGAGAALSQGYAQLQDAEEQLAEGRKTLEENRQQLQSDLAALDQYSSDEERLDAGMEILLQQPEISALAGRESTYGEICAAAARYLSGQMDSAAEEGRWAGRAFVLLISAGLLALTGAVLWFARKGLKAAAILSGLDALLSLSAAGLWKLMCPSLTALPFLAAALLLILSAIAVELIAKSARQTKVSFV